MTEEYKHFKIGFLKTLWLFKDYLSEIVIGGGWVPLIYYHYLLGEKSRFPIMTRDIDIMVNENIPVIGAKPLDKILTDAGLKTKFQGLTSHRPNTHYEGEIDNYVVEIEFLADLKGDGDKDVIEVQEGLYAEALRYISVSAQNTLKVNIDDLDLIGESQKLAIKVPTPGAFLFHKGLTFNNRRESHKKGKDLYYMFDVLMNCAEMEKQIFEELRILKSEYPIKWFKRFIANLATFCGDVSSEGISLINSQRPSSSYSQLNNDQFGQYVFGIFSTFIEKLRAILTETRTSF